METLGRKPRFWGGFVNTLFAELHDNAKQNGLTVL